MTELELLKSAIQSVTGMDDTTFGLSVPHWQLKAYKKGEFYNEYKNVCKHLGFVITGVFRIYHVAEETAEEKNMLFFTERQFMTSFKSFLNQTACEYHTASLTDSTVIYIHIDELNKLYAQSHGWEKFGRVVAEHAFNDVMSNTEGFLFKSPEQRYLEMTQKHPDIYNAVPLYHIASYLGIKGPSLSRIRKRMAGK